MTGGELINLLYEELNETDLIDSEIILKDVLEILDQIEVPKEYYCGILGGLNRIDESFTRN